MSIYRHLTLQESKRGRDKRQGYDRESTLGKRLVRGNTLLRSDRMKGERGENRINVGGGIGRREIQLVKAIMKKIDACFSDKGLFSQTYRELSQI